MDGVQEIGTTDTVSQTNIQSKVINSDTMITTFKMYVIQKEALEDPMSVLDHESWYTFARSSGPGGQNVNKVNSKAILWWSPAHSKIWNGDVDSIARFQQLFGNKINNEGLAVISSQEYRDQPSNKAACMDKLKAMVQQAMTTPVERVASRPTMGSNQRRLSDKMADKRQRERRSFKPDYE